MRSEVMKRAWQLRKEYGYRIGTAQRLAWSEAKGVKLYGMNIDTVRSEVCRYLSQLADAITSADVYDVHAVNKYWAISDALHMVTDADGVALVDGKTAGLVKYAARHGAMIAA